VGINESVVRVVGWLSPIVTLALGSAIWPVIGFLDERPVMATDPAEVDRAFTVPSPSCSPKGLSSKSGGDVNWLDRAPTLTATSRSTSTECPETSSGVQPRAFSPSCSASSPASIGPRRRGFGLRIRLVGKAFASELLTRNSV